MTGAPPYGMRSPGQKQTSYGAYSPSSKNMSYYPNNEPYPHPPETSHPYPAPNSYTPSPHFTHPPSPLPTTLPPLNGNAPPPHSDTPPPYPLQHSATQLSLPRPFSTSVMTAPTQSTYGPSTTSHSHPLGRSEALSQSPQKESDVSYDGRLNGIGYPSQPATVREPPPRSPKESVSVNALITVDGADLMTDLLDRNLLELRTPCPLQAFCPSQRKTCPHVGLPHRYRRLLPLSRRRRTKQARPLLLSRLLQLRLTRSPATRSGGAHKIVTMDTKRRLLCR